MNKLIELKEALKEKFKLTDFGGDIGGFAIVAKDKGGSQNDNDLDNLCNDLLLLSVEYARSIVPVQRPEISILESSPHYHMNFGYNVCTYDIHQRIDQDLLSLKEKNI